MYLGALWVHGQDGNPDRLALAAHGLRELMEKLPMYLDLPIATKPPSLKDKVRGLAQSWGNCAKNSTCGGNPGWSGAIDGSLRKFLRKSHEFFAWFEVEHPTRKRRITNILRSLDYLKTPLPKAIEELRVEEWDKSHEYFELVSHHTHTTTFEDFVSWVTALEYFLLDRLHPRTFDDHGELDEIIKEGEANAQS
jgi:hypothetical protein